MGSRFEGLKFHFGIARLDFFDFVCGFKFSQKFLKHKDTFVHPSFSIGLQ